MKIINKYIIKKYPLVFLLSFLLFTFLFILEKFFLLAELIIKNQVILEVLLIFLYSLPSVVAFTIPISLLTSSLLIWGKLKCSNEIFIILQAGYKPILLMRFICGLGVIMTLLNFLFNEGLLPHANYKTKELLHTLGRKNPLITLKEGKFLKIENTHIFVERIVKKSNNILKNITIHMRDDKNQAEFLIFAKEGRVYSKEDAVIFDLYDGFLHSTLEPTSQKYRIMKFRYYHLPIGEPQEDYIGNTKLKGIRELNFLELITSIKSCESLGIETSVIKFEIAKRIALPLTNLVFILLGSILATVLFQNRVTKGIVFGIVSLVIIGYYFLLTFGQIIGERNLINPILAAFIPNIFFLITTILFSFKFFRVIIQNIIKIMNRKIGIPAALLPYYKQFVFWRSFFESLSFKVITSRRSNKQILMDGLKFAEDEACLPLKLFYGHVYDLVKYSQEKEKLDYIFIPRIVSLKNRTHYCPKFIGLPDLILSSIPQVNKNQIIDKVINLNKEPFYISVYKIGLKLCKNFVSVIRAYNYAKKTEIMYLNRLCASVPKKAKKVLILGHPYNIYDGFVNANILSYLKKNGIFPLTLDMLPPDILNRKIYLSEYWSFTGEFLNALYYAISSGDIKGIINIVCFSCGPDSLLSELIAREASRYKFRHLKLVLDEHNSAVGIMTRLEAFLDVI